MAKINIYGTLHNDTGDPIADAKEVYDTRDKKSPRCLADTLDSMEMEPMKAWEVNDMIYDVSHNYVSVPIGNEPSKGPWG